mmetsp:Transcript_20123/g.50076  ORF Transcript_20123/g.50076 Transcript_20123/m.50076 type:complete len:96 (+) Transcript_20123:1271-1558(+)
MEPARTTGVVQIFSWMTTLPILKILVGESREVLPSMGQKADWLCLAVALRIYNADCRLDLGSARYCRYGGSAESTIHYSEFGLKKHTLMKNEIRR